jgi:ABC-2 type transport system permease protein
MLQNLYNVIRREIRIWCNRPIYFLGSVGVMLAATLFFTTFMKEGIPQDLRIGVVDLDNSSTSRNFRQQLDATQMGQVVEFGSVSAAQRELETGRINGYVVVPEHFDQEVQAFHCPKMQVQVNLMYPVIGGALAYKDILYMVNLTNGAVQRQVLRAKGVPESEIMGRLQPIALDAHNIGNGPTNYSYYLINMILMGILGMCVTLVVAYSVGTELKYGTSKHLLEVTGDDLWTAIVGKLVPYTVLFTVLGVCLQLLLFGPLHYPHAGSVGWLILATLAMIMAYEAIAVFIVSVVPTLRLGVCLSALYSVLGFSFAGFTLPISALPAGIQGLSTLFPLRFYYLIYTQVVYYGNGFAAWWPFLVALLAFQLLPIVLYKRLYNAYKYQNYPRN